MSIYRLNKKELLKNLALWDGFLKRRIRLIACGGTAMTLLGIKDSTKDIDLIVPVESEHAYLIKVLSELGYRNVTGRGWSRDDGFVFDLFPGKRVHTTELLESPLEKGNHALVKEYSHVYLGILNDYDIIISKLFRGTEVDHEDCLMLAKHQRRSINWKELKMRFLETASYDISKDKVIKHWEHFVRLARKEGLCHEEKRSRGKAG